MANSSKMGLKLAQCPHQGAKKNISLGFETPVGGNAAVKFLSDKYIGAAAEA